MHRILGFTLLTIKLYSLLEKMLADLQLLELIGPLTDFRVWKTGNPLLKMLALLIKKKHCPPLACTVKEGKVNP